MNYNHHYHAGNFADCLKHVILFAVLAYFRERNKPFLAVDAFAGAGLYDLASLEPQKTGEKDEGISCWFKNPPQSALVRGFFQRFHQLSGSGKEVSFYPGSPMYFTHGQTAGERCLLMETHPDTSIRLHNRLPSKASWDVIEQDGYATTLSRLPAPEKRALLLMDPPFEKPNEFRALTRFTSHALKRQANATVIVWYPIKDIASSMALEETARVEATESLIVHLDIGEGRGLRRCGVVVTNPPFTLFENLAQSRADFAHLGHGKGRLSLSLYAKTDDDRMSLLLKA